MILLEWPKRTWVYARSPTVYSIRCDECGGDNIEWSEWERLIWCYDCELDVKGTEGIFGGPIPVNLCRELGIGFDKITLN